MKVGVIGTGYVGLVAGACFADTGNQVICVDKDPKKIAKLRAGGIPIFEPGLEDLVKRNIQEGRLHFTDVTADAVTKCDVLFMAVGTPTLADGKSDLSYLKAAVEEVASCMPSYRLIVNKSTVPIGTHETVATWMRAKTSHPFDVASNPEFLKEGSAVDDFMKPDRVIIGTHKDSVFETLYELYSPFVRQGNPIIRMEPISAEMTKYACNAFLATRISFMNELSNLCEALGGDIEDIRKGMTTDPRIGKHFLYAGVGYGGSCFPKDVKALISTGQEAGIPLQIVEATESANERQKKFLLKPILKVFGPDLKGRKFAFWGLAFKPNTDDIREAPALVLFEEIEKRGGMVQAFDPVAMPNVKEILGSRIRLVDSSYAALEGADALVIMTEWNEFRNPDLERIKNVLKRAVIFDGRNILDPAKCRKKGFEYYGVGRVTRNIASSNGAAEKSRGAGLDASL